MSTKDVILLRKDMKEGFNKLGKRLDFLERTVYTIVGGIIVVGFLITTGNIRIG